MISTHILDTSQGAPAAGVKITLSHRVQGVWVILEEGETNSDGRFKFTKASTAGDYQLLFAIEDYIADSFFLNIPIGFQIKDIERNYHVPLLLSPFGLATYRGS